MPDIIPKPKVKIPEWQNILLYASLITLSIVILLCAVFGYFQNKLSQEIQAKESELLQIGTPEQKILEKEILAYEKKIQNFGILLNSHQYNTNFLKLLENLAHQDTVFTDIFLDASEYKAVITGETKTFKTLGDQLKIFEQEEMLKNVELSNMSMGKEGKVQFTFNLEIEPEIFQ